MTREEKRQRIAQYCDRMTDEACRDKKCPLSLVDGSCFVEESADIDRNYEILFGADETESESNNPYWERITKVATRQRSKGLKEYGRGVEDDTADINVRLDRIEEELIDALMYLEHLRDAVNKIKEVVG